MTEIENERGVNVSLQSQATWRLFCLSSNTRLSFNRNGRSRRLRMSWLGLCRGWVARETWDWPRRTLAANFLTPASRITFPMACWSGIPSSTAAKINRRANSGSRTSRAKPSSQSLLVLAMMHHLQIVGPIPLRKANVLALRGFIPLFESENPGLNPSSYRNIKRVKPPTEGVNPPGSHILPNNQLHPETDDCRPARKSSRPHTLFHLRSVGCT